MTRKRLPLLWLLLMLVSLPVSGQQPSAEDPRVVFERAQKALLAKDYSNAEKGFKEVLRLDPRSAAAYSNLGVVYMRLERYNAAIPDIPRSQEVDSGDARNRPQPGSGLLP